MVYRDELRAQQERINSLIKDVKSLREQNSTLKDSVKELSKINLELRQKELKKGPYKMVCPHHGHSHYRDSEGQTFSDFIKELNRQVEKDPEQQFIAKGLAVLFSIVLIVFAGVFLHLAFWGLS